MNKIYILPLFLLILLLGGLVMFSMLDLAPAATETTKEISLETF